MIPSSRRRLVGAAAALTLLGATLLSTAGVATAQTPVGWSIHVVPLPDKVTPGADAGYRVTIGNTGPSNISQVYLLNDPTKGNPTYVDDSIATGGRLACTDPGAQLLCSFGALNAGESVTVIVGYNTSGFASPFDPVLETTSNGVSFQDPKRSHGDALTDPTGVTSLVTNKNFGGGFTRDSNGSVQNNGQLNGQNKQSEKVTHLPAGIAATVQDGTDTTGSCVSDGIIDCNKLIGEWTILSVNGGADFRPGGYFIVQVTFKTGTPLYFVHSAGGAYSQEDILPCSGGTFDGVTQCFTWDAGTSTATIYLFHNNPIRG